jgi:hypothetical protein
MNFKCENKFDEFLCNNYRVYFWRYAKVVKIELTFLCVENLSIKNVPVRAINFV